MITLLQKGGFVMWPIAALGVVTIGILIERILYFYLTGVSYEKFRSTLLGKISGGDIVSLDLIDRSAYAGKSWNIFGRVLHWIRQQQWNRSAYLKVSETYALSSEKGNRSREEALRRVGSEEIERMEKNFKGLSAISHVSPLLGLLGTVTGIIGSFSVISELGGQVDVTALASGIWEAMLTTAAGLVVAIPSQLAYLYFEKIVTSRANRMSYIITYMDEELHSVVSCSDDSAEPARAEELIHHVESGEQI